MLMKFNQKIMIIFLITGICKNTTNICKIITNICKNTTNICKKIICPLKQVNVLLKY